MRLQVSGAVLAAVMMCLCGLFATGCGAEDSGAADNWSGASITLFDNGTDGAVGGGPTAATVFLADRAYRITRIATYHWNGGGGKDAAEAGGTLSLTDAEGTVFGPWTASSEDPDLWWETAPETVLPAGRYTLTDSDPATWSFETAGDGRGIAVIEGIAPDDDPSPEVEVLDSRELAPSDSEQAVTAGDITVKIPGGLLKKKATLEIGRISEPSESGTTVYVIDRAYSVSLGALHDLAVPVTIEVAYDPTGFTEEMPPEKALVGLLYDPLQRVWGVLPAQVDTQRNVLILSTDHLSEIAWARVVTSDMISNEAFMLTYDKAEVEKGTGPKVGWYMTYDPLVEERWPEVPDYVEDLWFNLNQATAVYEDFEFKPLPRGSPLGYAGYLFSHPTRAFLGGAGSSNRNKITKNLIFTLDFANNYTIMRRTVAHEVFHCVQAQYFTSFGLMARKWWVEATAEYAGNKLAWGTTAGMGGEKLHPGFLEKPLDYAATLLDAALSESPHNYHEYNSAFFIDFLVEKKKWPFKELWDAVAKYYNTDVLVPLDDFIRGKEGSASGLWAIYQEFAEYWVFDAASPVRAQLESAGLKSISKDAFDKPVALADTNVFTVGGASRMASELMRMPFEFGEGGVRNLSVSVSMKKEGMSAILYAVSGDSVASSRRLGELEWRDSEGASVSFELKQDEVLYLLLMNGGFNGRELFYVSVVTKEKRSTKTFTFNGSRTEEKLLEDIMQWPSGGNYPLPQGLTFNFSTSGTIVAPKLETKEPTLSFWNSDTDKGSYRLDIPVGDAEVLINGTATYEVVPSEMKVDHGSDYYYYEVWKLKEKRIVYPDKMDGNKSYEVVMPEGGFGIIISKLPEPFGGYPTCSNAYVQIEFDFEMVMYQKDDDEETDRKTITYRPFIGPFGIGVCLK